MLTRTPTNTLCIKHVRTKQSHWNSYLLRLAKKSEKLKFPKFSQGNQVWNQPFWSTPKIEFLFLLIAGYHLLINMNYSHFKANLQFETKYISTGYHFGKGIFLSSFRSFWRKFGLSLIAPNLLANTSWCGFLKTK